MLAPSRAGVSQAFVDWLHAIDRSGKLFLTVVTIHELEKGIALLESKGAIAKAKGLKIWLVGLTTTYADRILDFDTGTAAVAGKLEAKAISAGTATGMADAIIAGIAASRDLHVVTHNVKHFQPFGVAVSSPDEAVQLP
jgi:predicted nucleic acid-binding protein